MPASTGVIMTPDGDSTNRDARVERQIIFPTVKIFFEFLGMTADFNRAAIMLEDRNQTRAGGVQYVRLMGSMRRNHNDRYKPLLIYPGRGSCCSQTVRFSTNKPLITQRY